MFEHQFLDGASVLRSAPFTPGMVVGDFGCGGTASISIPLARRVGPDGLVMMFDVRKAIVQAATSAAKMRGVQNVRGIWTDLEVFRGARDVADASLDGGVIVALLHESNHHLEILTEVARMLKPQAELVIVEWEKDSTHPLAPTLQQRLTAEYCTNVAKQAGLMVTSTFSPDHDHWGLILKKV